MIRVLRGSELPPNHLNFTSKIFQKLHKNKRNLEVSNNVLYRKFYHNFWRKSFRRSNVPAETMDYIFRTLHNNLWSYTLDFLKSCTNYAHYITQPTWRRKYNTCRQLPDAHSNDTVSRQKPATTVGIHLRPVQWTGSHPWSRFSWPTVQLEWLHLQLTAIDVFSRYLFPLLIRKPDTASIVKALLTSFTQHDHVPEQILTHEGCAFTSKLHTELMETARVKFANDTLKHA